MYRQGVLSTSIHLQVDLIPEAKREDKVKKVRI